MTVGPRHAGLFATGTNQGGRKDNTIHLSFAERDTTYWEERITTNANGHFEKSWMDVCAIEGRGTTRLRIMVKPSDKYDSSEGIRREMKGLIKWKPGSTESEPYIVVPSL